MAAFSIRLAGNYTRPASREACRRAAVKPRPSRMSPEYPARLWRAVRGAGGHPLPCALRAQSGVKGLSPLFSRREGRKFADVAETEVLQKTIRGGVKNGTA